MTKKKTRKQKERTSQRLAGTSGFKVAFSSIGGSKIDHKVAQKSGVEAKYFRSDLTKVIVLTMLALALEVALWLYLVR